MFGEVMWTEASEAHIARHNVIPSEVEEVIYGRPRDEAQVTDAQGRTALLVLGQTAAGRYLTVLVGEAADGRDYVITARDMTDNERDTFRERGR